MEPTTGEPESLEKVVLSLENDEAETLWAERVNHGIYRLRNVPIFAFGYSEGDIVSTVERDGRQVVTGTHTGGGHSTYRIIFPEKTIGEQFKRLWEPLVKLGCTYERASGRMIGVDVPPSTNIHAVYAVLERGEQEGYWIFEEGHCGHPLCNVQ